MPSAGCRYLQGDEVPNKVLFTDTWLLIIPQLVWYYPGREMGMLAHVTAPPDTVIRAAQGVSSSGNATLAFYLVGDSLAVQPGGGKPSSAADQSHGIEASVLNAQTSAEFHRGGLNGREVLSDSQKRVLKAWSLSAFNASQLTSARTSADAYGKHLFTLKVGGELVAKEITIEPDLPLRPEGYRLRVAMELVKSSLYIGVEKSDIGDINEDRLMSIMTVAAFLVEAKINDEILKDGFPLPDIPHVQVINPGVQVVDFALSMDSSVQYVP